MAREGPNHLLSRNFSDEFQTGMNIPVLPALWQDRRQATLSLIGTGNPRPPRRIQVRNFNAPPDAPPAGRAGRGLEFTRR
jgi:hypothetical protein